MCVSSMKNRSCGKTCKNGFHLKGTSFQEKISVQPMLKTLQQEYRIESTHEFPPVSQVQIRTNGQQQNKEAHGNVTQANLNVPPPSYEFKCTDCSAAFKYRSELKNHIRADHTSNDVHNEATFLDAIQKALDKMLPRFIESAMVTMQNRLQPNQTGNNMQSMRWGLIPASLN